MRAVHVEIIYSEISTILEVNYIKRLTKLKMKEVTFSNEVLSCLSN